VFVLDFFVPRGRDRGGSLRLPVQVKRFSVSAGRVSAPGIGVTAEYMPAPPAELGDRAEAFAAHPSAYCASAGISDGWPADIEG
jgi:hypothetical protein